MKRRHAYALTVLLALAFVGVLWQAAAISRAAALATVREDAQRALERYGTSLQGLLETYAVLPRLLAQEERVTRALLAPDDVALRAALNQRLAAFNATAQATDTYVIAADGLTIAASNADTPVSFVGMNFGFRPYFQNALAGGSGLYFALGTTSNRPGFYFSYPVRHRGQVIGVCVVKIDRDRVENSWSQTATPVIVTDAEGVVFITNRADLRYRTLQPLSRAARERIEAARQYVDQPLEPLPLADGHWLDGALRSISLRETRAEADGRRSTVTTGYLVETSQVNEAGWHVHVLAPLAPVDERVRYTLLGVGSTFSVALLLGLFWRQRRHRLRDRLHYQARVEETLRRARDELEVRVADRTRELQRAQNDLIQASKLAALGQLSAGLVHELNQPLAAIRGYADNAAVLLDRERYAEARTNLATVVELTDRMSVLTGQLRGFARKTGDEVEAVELGRSITNAIALIEPRLRGDQVTLTVTRPSQPVWLRGNAIRLEQVLVNLLKNACDALRDAAERRIELALDADGARARIGVRDTGPGIAPDALERLFDPFFTTKPVGEGLGLGLSISYGIVDAFGGTLRATHHPDGGALFTIDLPQAPPP